MPLVGHERIALDSNILIYLLEGDGPLADGAARVLDALSRGDADGVMASVGVTEILAGPARDGEASGFERTAAALREMPITVVAFDHSLAEDAAWLRGALGVSMTDAIHLATARRAGATAFITNDRRLRSIARLEVIDLDAIA
jgi:predicted nucleic acid-binding protein